MAEQKYALMQDQLNEHQNELMELHGQIDTYRQHRVDGEMMVQTLISGKNEKIGELEGQLKVMNEQVESMRQTLETWKSINGVQRLQEERDRYLAELKMYSGGASPAVVQFSGTDEQKYLKAKNYHYETLVERLERERSELQTKLAFSLEQ